MCSSWKLCYRVVSVIPNLDLLTKKIIFINLKHVSFILGIIAAPLSK